MGVMGHASVIGCFVAIGRGVGSSERLMTLILFVEMGVLGFWCLLDCNCCALMCLVDYG
ncbi:hypothetical protein QJS04_geneDACA006247 [Acorus gramineus]|uniref:Transmembrane protein n=1 Tax=Acorus gramineus TaxID=55184 RepID=A0AAV9B142_ACOGR|nr:hypothetical protein QJS04_geneDACA006247 [Acorus gramineus]